jgi:hypothetical protein
MLNKTYNIVFFLYLFSGLIFLIASLLVRFFPSNSKFVSRKLKTGALLLILSSAASGCKQDEGTVTCYACPPTETTQYTSQDTVQTNDDHDSLSRSEYTTKKIISPDSVIRGHDSVPDARCYGAPANFNQ